MSKHRRTKKQLACRHKWAKDWLFNQRNKFYGRLCVTCGHLSPWGLNSDPLACDHVWSAWAVSGTTYGSQSAAIVKRSYKRTCDRCRGMQNETRLVHEGVPQESVETDISWAKLL